MKNVRSILNAYQIKPSEVSKVTNNLYRIQAQEYSFALKKSKLNRNQIDSWKQAYIYGNEYQLTSILPVYMTEKGDIFHQDYNDIYYLTPWKETRRNDEPEHEVESFYRTLGTIHHKTKKKLDIQVDQVEQQITQEKEKLSRFRQSILTNVELYESKRYMSPFELRVCMQYRDIEQVCNSLDDWYDYYLEDLKEDGVMNHSLCHGNLRASHLIYQSSNTYFVNWEKSHIGSPMYDLAVYYYHELKYHDCYLNHLMSSFSIYEKENPLLLSERSLLAVLLLTPSSYLQVIEAYNNKQFSKSQPFQIRYLEQAYRRLVHGLSMQQHLKQIRDEIKQKQLEEEANQEE
ncbi:protein kinase family protein [Aquibacillus kalidii]|uniref:hypothetical protein n=1 Tax=Aquibacillus kalidii TaxID=2762597 RepID=UPI001646722A|nr:hypothetical protein [Aquibacillus kalidii]